MLYDLVVLTFKVVPIFLFCDILAKINVGQIKNNEDINLYFLTKFISVSNTYYKIRGKTETACTWLNKLLSYDNENDSEDESKIELIRLYVLKPNKIIQGLYTFSLEDSDDEESDDESDNDESDNEESDNEESDNDESDNEESNDEESDEKNDDGEKDTEEKDTEEEYITESLVTNAKILFAGGKATDVNDDDIILAYDSPTRSYQQISKNSIDLENNEKTIVDIIKKINNELYNKSVFINVQLNLNDEVIDITKVSSAYYRTGNTIFNYKMVNYLTDFKYDINEDTEYSIMLMDSEVNMVNITNKQTITLENNNNTVVYKINNLN